MRIAATPHTRTRNARAYRWATLTRVLLYNARIYFNAHARRTRALCYARCYATAPRAQLPLAHVYLRACARQRAALRASTWPSSRIVSGRGRILTSHLPAPTTLPSRRLSRHRTLLLPVPTIPVTVYETLRKPPTLRRASRATRARMRGIWFAASCTSYLATAAAAWRSSTMCLCVIVAHARRARARNGGSRRGGVRGAGKTRGAAAARRATPVPRPSPLVLRRSAPRAHDYRPHSLNIITRGMGAANIRHARACVVRRA